MTNKKIIYQPVSPEIQEIADRYDLNKEAVLEILKEMDSLQQLNSTAINEIARALNIPANKVYGLATFYSMLTFDKHEGPAVRVCDGPVCWLKQVSETEKAILSNNVDGQ